MPLLLPEMHIYTKDAVATEQDTEKHIDWRKVHRLFTSMYLTVASFAVMDSFGDISNEHKWATWTRTKPNIQVKHFFCLCIIEKTKEKNDKENVDDLTAVKATSAYGPQRVVRYFISSQLFSSLCSLYPLIIFPPLSLSLSPSPPMEVTSSFISTTSSSKYLTLTSYSPVILPASSLRSIRTDFLGCCHTLRPPPHHHHLRTRTGKRKTSRSSPRLVVRASIDSGLILVVVAVTAFSAIAFAYCQNSFRKRKLSDKVSQVSDKTSQLSDKVSKIYISFTSASLELMIFF